MSLPLSTAPAATGQAEAARNEAPCPPVSSAWTGFDHGDGCEQLLHCKSLSEVEQAVERIARSYGFDHFLYGVRMPLDGGHVVEHISTNYDPVWRDTYQQQEFVRVDPTVQHCVQRVTPLRWQAAHYATDAQQELLAQAHAAGLRSGLSIPVHGSRGETAMLSLAIDGHESQTQRFLERAAPLAQRLASYVHEALDACLRPPAPPTVVRLTPREAEVLRWVGLGKTNWEMARILVVSEHAVTYHLRNVMHKLQVSSRHQAVRQAVALGLLEL